MDFIIAAILATIEGITEFLPISSTGHLILAEHYLQLSDDKNFNNAFIVIIQLPAIASVVLYFWKILWPFQEDKNLSDTIQLWSKIFVAFIPAAILGLLFNDYIEYYLMDSITVAVALIIGGIVLIGLELRDNRSKVLGVENITYLTAFWVGCFQCLAMIPGTSRSAATIIGGIALGMNRTTAAEFSFFLAIPTMLGATTITLLKHGLDFTAYQWALLGVGSVISFLVAYASIAFLMRFIQQHSFIPFGIYRIILGGIVLGYFLWIN